MKTQILLLSLGLAVLSCSKAPVKNGLVQVSEEKLETASKGLCPTNSKFKIFTGEIALGIDSLPNPTLFAISRGPDYCANLHEIDHGGLTTWLKVTYDTDCIENASLWMIDHIREGDGNDLFIDMKSIDPSQGAKVHIFTSRGYSLVNLREKMGLVVYNCVE